MGNYLTQNLENTTIHKNCSLNFTNERKYLLLK